MDFEADGALILDNVIDRLLVRELFRAVSQIDKPELIPGASNVGNGRWMFPVDLDWPFSEREVWFNPKVHPTLTAFLGTDYELANIGVVCSFPGADVQHRHRDGGDLLFKGTDFDVKLPPYAITVMMPLREMNELNGSTGLWLGSHRSDDCELFIPTVAEGSCILWDFRLTHFGQPNRSTAIRPLLYLTVCRPWFTDHTNGERRMPFHASAEFLSSLSPPERRVLARVKQK